MSRLLALGVCTVAAGAARAQDVRTSISGTVYDSVSRRYLDSAVVQLMRADRPGTGVTVISAGGGKFQFDSVEAGTWILGFIHPVLDSLGLPLPTVQVQVRTAEPIRAMLAVPSPASVVRRFCGVSPDSGGLWYGQTRSGVTGLPVAAATVIAQWNRIVVVNRTIERQIPAITIESNEDGSFHHCFMPREEIVLVRAWRGADSSGVLSFTMPAAGLLRRDIYVGPVQVVDARVAVDSTADSVTVPMRIGGGSLRGRVLRSGGRPVGGARVRFSESGAEAMANGDGYFHLDSLPLGSFTIDARAIGFLPVTRSVDFVEGQVTTADFVLESRQSYLDTVRVVSRRLMDTPQHLEFLARKKLGFGTFLDEEDIEKRNPMFVSDVLRVVPGVTVLPGGFGGSVRFRNTGGFAQYCVPAVFIDGMQVFDISSLGLETVVSPEIVRAIEVYPRPLQVPAQYRTTNGCGSLVIWTGPRSTRVPPPS
ncbi:MAG: carboxypeptidase regulatory-like domain-containing protein [Cytophagaceae bacterium]|nr:carboxypeptidase regulatory-like domain-containing protein [Gemmatimonadaceae bacterium]